MEERVRWDRGRRGRSYFAYGPEREKQDSIPKAKRIGEVDALLVDEYGYNEGLDRDSRDQQRTSIASTVGSEAREVTPGTTPYFS